MNKPPQDIWIPEQTNSDDSNITPSINIDGDSYYGNNFLSLGGTKTNHTIEVDMPRNSHTNDINIWEKNHKPNIVLLQELDLPYLYENEFLQILQQKPRTIEAIMALYMTLSDLYFTEWKNIQLSKSILQDHRETVQYAIEMFKQSLQQEIDYSDNNNDWLQTINYILQYKEEEQNNKITNQKNADTFINNPLFENFIDILYKIMLPYYRKG
jgi:hypothetical protein